MIDTINLGAMKKKKKQVSSMSPLASKNITENAYTNGKSRVQGGQGVGQGGQGWKSQHTDGGYAKQINPILQSLSSSTKYETPKIKDSLLTKDGFNQALGVIGARNKAKISMQNKRTMQGVLGSLISGDAQNRATQSRANSDLLRNASNERISDRRNDTAERGQNMNYASQSNKLQQQVTQNKSVDNHYQRQDAVAKESNNLRREEMENKQPMSVQDRQKIVKDNGLQGILDSKLYQSLSEEQQQNIAGRYMVSGELPTLIGGEEGMFYDGETQVSYGKASPAQVTTPKATGVLFNDISKELGIDRGSLKLSDDGNNIVLPDGRVASLSDLSERYRTN